MNFISSKDIKKEINNLLLKMQIGENCIGETSNKLLLLFSVRGSLQEHKQVIKDLLETYIINLDEDGSPKASITDIMKLIDRAVKLVGNDR